MVGHEADRAAVAARGGAARRAARHGAQRPHAGTAASSRVASASASKSASSSGVRSAIAARWRATVASSPRAIGPVSAPLAARARAQFSTRRADERDQQLAVGARLRGEQALGGGLEGDEEVRGDRRRGVVGGAVGVVDLDGAACRARSASSRAAASAPASAPATAQPAPANVGAGAGHGHQRVQREALVRRERRERRGAGAVADQAAGGGATAAAAARDLARRARTGARRRRPRRRCRGPAGAPSVQRAGKRGAQASAPDDGDGLAQRWSSSRWDTGYIKSTPQRADRQPGVSGRTTGVSIEACRRRRSAARR